MSDQFKYLLSPTKLGPITLCNRVVVSAHLTRLGDPNPTFGGAGFLGERYAYYVAERAKGGAGLIILGQYAVHPTTRTETPNLSIAYDEGAIPGMKLAVDMCHQHGAKVLVQLFHSGFLNTTAVDGTQVWSASEISAPPSPAFAMDVAKPMEKEDIEELKQYYARSSRNAMVAGADGMEIHAAHGYLLQQFLSPFTNKRTDEYGGSLENRLRLTVEVLDAVRNEIGRAKVLGLRFSADEFIPGGLTLEDMKEVARILDALGVIDYINVSQGLAIQNPPIVIPPLSVPHGGFVHHAAAIREVVDNVKVIAVGRIVDPVEAEKVLADGHADLVVMTRAHIADPEVVTKTREGRLDEIRACVADCLTCLGPASRMRGLQCCQNPAVGREKELGAEIVPAPKKKRVMVVGGGPGGLEAAWLATARGHDVTLYEQDSELGGRMLLARQLPTLGELDGLVRWRKRMVEKYGVKVVLNTEVTAGLVERERPDTVVIATGAITRRDGFNSFTNDIVPGWDSPHVVTPEEILQGTVQVGQNVLVCDMELYSRGVGIAETLAGLGKSVRLVYPNPMPGACLVMQVFSATLSRLVRSGIELCANTLVTGIEGPTVKGIDTINRQPRSFGGVDTVVMVGRPKANTSLYEAIKGKVPQLYRVGDAIAPRTSDRAIFEAYNVAREI